MVDFANPMIKIDNCVINKYHNKIINVLAQRGWACYCTGVQGIMFLSENDIKDCVISNGREKRHFKKDMIYTILPFVDNDFCWDDVRREMERCVKSNRYPFFVDMDTKEGTESNEVYALGVYLIDSVLFNSEEMVFEFVIDYDLMLQLGLLVDERYGNIVIDILNIDKISKQLTLCRRENSSDLIK